MWQKIKLLIFIIFKILLKLVSILIFVLILIFILNISSISSTLKLEEYKSKLQIVYYLVISIIAILTYLSAKKTIFMPLENEVFKLQLKTLEEIYSYLNKKLIGNSIENFGLQETISCNILKIIGDYNKLKNFSSDNFKYDYNLINEKCEYSLYNDKHLCNVEDKLDKSKEFDYLEKNTYKKIPISKITISCKHQIQTFTNIPYLPTKIKEELEDLSKTIETLNDSIGHILEEYIKEIKKTIISVEDSENFDLANGIEFWNKRQTNVNILDEKCDDILKKIKKYLKTDSVFKR